VHRQAAIPLVRVDQRFSPSAEARIGSLWGLPTLVRDPQPAEFAALLERRRRFGQDLFDEVWDGVLHINPAPSGRHGDLESQLHVLLRPLAAAAGLRMHGQFNLGEDQDYRVPDGGLHRDAADRVYYPSAALVIEIVSPDDETWSKLGFYAAHQVGELLIVDPERRTIDWLSLRDNEYEPIERSALIASGPAELAEGVDWPE
jgi:Uma2 family endonuclease